MDNFDNERGLFLVIDDINGLSQSSEFANWYKSFADTLSTTFEGKIPLVIMLTSHPKVVRRLYDHNPSFNRIFIYRPLDFLDKSEVEDFFIKRFGSRDIEIEKSALDLMVEFSAGSPAMMQNIGDEIYLLNRNHIISKEDTLEGIRHASREIELRYLQDSLDQFNLTENDLKILRIIGKDFINNGYGNYSFNLNNFSKFDEFVEKSIDAKIIEEKSENEYIFTNDLYPIYFAINGEL